MAASALSRFVMLQVMEDKLKPQCRIFNWGKWKLWIYHWFFIIILIYSDLFIFLQVFLELPEQWPKPSWKISIPRQRLKGVLNHRIWILWHSMVTNLVSYCRIVYASSPNYISYIICLTATSFITHNMMNRGDCTPLCRKRQRDLWM